MKKLIYFLISVCSITIHIHAQWQLTNGPLADVPNTRRISSHPNGDLYVVTSENELFRSTDNSLSWEKLIVFDADYINVVKISPLGVIYIGTESGYYVSTDDGITWQEKQVFFDGAVSDFEFSVNKIFISQSWFGIQNGIWISSDNGANWTQSIIGLNGDPILAITKDSFENLYVVTVWAHIFKSTNSGQTWELKIDLPGVADDIEIDSFDNLFVAASSDGNGIFKSTDLGNSWHMVSSKMTFNIFIDINNNIYIHDYYYLRFSSDGGNTWTNINYPGSQIYDVIVISDTIFLATEIGLQKSTDFGVNWVLCLRYNDRYVNVNDILVLSDDRILAGTNEELFFIENNFLSWSSTSITTGVNIIKRDNMGNIYVSAAYLYRSTDEGITWEIPYNIVPDNPRNVQNIFINDSGYIFTIQSNGSPGIYVPSLKSTDFGVSWNQIWSTFCACNAGGFGHSIIENFSGTLFVSYEFHKPPPDPFSDIVIKKKETGSNWTTVYNTKIASNMYLYKQALYMATRASGSPSLGIIKSTDDGNSFVQLNNGLSNLSIKQLILNPEVFLALTGDGIYRSLDEGNYWVRLDLTGLNANINRIYLDDSQILYACTDNGIYFYTGALPVELTSFAATTEQEKITLNWTTESELNNHGFEIERSFNKTNWVTIGFREGKGTTSEPQQYSYSNNIAELTAQKLFYRLKQIDFNGNFEYSKIVEVEIAPSNFSLYQNYPNPFNPSTSIQYAISNRQFVTLKVYDVLGKEIATLVNEEKSAGSYETEFNASHLASGIYYYQLRAGDYVETKKMILLK